MTLIAAICHSRGGLVDPAAARRLLASGLLLRPWRASVHVDPMIALTAQQFVHALHDGEPAQPVTSRYGTCRALLDGRIDNRAELLEELVGCGACRPRACDAELLAGAYELWGPACAPRIHGEFAWLVWDVRSRRLVGARDAFGLRPLFYTQVGDIFVCASQLDQVCAAVPEHPRELDEAFLADFFVRSYARPAVSPISGVLRLPPAHQFILQNGRLRVERYWDLEERQKLHYRDDRDYAIHFRELFENAVRAQLHTGRGAVWADLSGGLDSSSITCTAARLLDSGCAHQRRLFATISWVAEQSRGEDDLALQSAVLGAYPVVNNRLSADEHHAFQHVVDGARYWDEPAEEIFSFALQREVARLLAAHDVSALLRGVGAECVVLSELEPPLHLADLFRSGHVRTWAREMRLWQRALRHPLLVMAARYSLRPLLRPGGIAVGEFRAARAPGWLAPDFVRRTSLTRRMRETWQRRRFRDVADQWQYEQLVHLAGYQRPGCLHKACDVRLPFLHRPLVEFAFRIPWREKVKPGTYKQLLRDAMTGVVPEQVRTWKRKIGATGTAFRALDAEFESMLTLLERNYLVEAGIVDGAQLRRRLDLLRVGAEHFSTGLLRPLVTEAWLRARTGRRLAADALPRSA